MRQLSILLMIFASGAAAAQDDILRDLQGAKPDTAAGARSPAGAQPAEPAPGPVAAPPPAAGDGEAPAETPATSPDDPPVDSEPPAATSDSNSSPALQWLDSVTKSGPMGMIREGGVFMLPILLLGILAAGVIIERYRSLQLLESDSTALRMEAQDLLHQDRIEDAFHLCNQAQGPVPAVLACGLRKFLVLRNLKYDAARTEEQVVKAMEDHSIHIVAALERHLPILATISSVAPMLGFLGTVSGMITSFKSIEAMFEGAGGGQNIVQAAAGGISVALITTCFGLIIGIPAFMAYNYFTGIINRFVLEVEESTTELIEGVTLQLALAGVQSGAAPQREVSPATLEASER